MLKTREHKLLVAVGVCLLLLLADRLVLSPLLNSWRTSRNEILELQGKLARDRAQTEQHAQWQTRMQEIQDRRLPNDQSAAEEQVMAEITACARRSGLDITAVRPVWEGNGSKERRSLRLRLAGVGNLAAIQQFVMAIETSKLPLCVRFLEIRNTDDRGAKLELDVEISAVLLAAGKEEA